MKKLRLKLYIKEEEVDTGIREEEDVDSGPLGLYFNLKLSH